MPYATNAECRIYYETFGSPADPPLVLVNGLGSQCINYPVAWCEMFAGAGFHVTRFDNRDVGLSTHFDDGRPYTVDDMTSDAVAVIDAIGVERAHVLGLSMGGMIVQQLAIHHPERVLSIVAVMTRTSEPDYGQSTPDALAQLLAPAPPDREAAIAAWIAGLRIWGSPAFADEARWRADAEAAFDRAFDPAGTVRQFRAIAAAEPWADALPGVTTPTLVMHGDHDTLIDISGGRRIAELIPGAHFVAIEGMGHDYPPQLWQRWVDEVARFCRSVNHR